MMGRTVEADHGSTIARLRTAVTVPILAHNGAVAIVDPDFRDLLDQRGNIAGRRVTQAIRQRDHVAAHWGALGRVTLEESGSRVAAQRELDLPCQIAGVLDPGVHSLSARRAGNVRGVSGDENAALAVLLDNLVLNPEPCQPRHIADIRIGLGTAAHNLAE